MNDKILILAAGNSSRLGQNKQLLTVNGLNLLERAVKTCFKAKIGDIFLVLGFQAEKHFNNFDNTSVGIIVNSEWQTGMGSSISNGVAGLDETADGVYFVLPDQIKLTSEILQAIQSKKEENLGCIIASKYGNHFGAPCYFPSQYFDALRECIGSQGAKKVIMENLTKVKYVDFPGGEIDVDTPEDLKLVD